MASKVTAAPEDLEESENEAGAGQGGATSFLGRLFGLLGRFRQLSRKQLILVGGVAVLLLLLSGGVWFFFLKGSGNEHEAPKSVFHDLPELLVNLSTANERPQYLRMKITLEVADTNVVNALKPVMPRVLDTFQVHLRELRLVDLEGSSGLFRLREELTRRINHAIAPARIRAVLFKEIVVQ